ncbi:MAG: DinB family protein [Candidatus Limnocylindrales bacterium]
MAHPRVEQLHFARSEWRRCLRGLRADDAVKRLEPMNSISWMIGHLAWHERLIWLERARGLRVEPVLDRVATGLPASTPPLATMLAAWKHMVELADPFMDALTTADLERALAHDLRPSAPTAGTQLQRITYHYWSHIGEASAVRQMLGHQRLAQFVGDIDRQAPFRREPD